MYCRNCGKELEPTTSFCPVCGQPVNGGQPTGGPGSYNPNGPGNQYDPYYQPPAKQGPDGYAIASLVLGIVSFFVIPIIGAILAIVFGNKSIRDTGVNTMARVGKILGIVSLAIYIVVIVLIVVVFILLGVSTMSEMYYFM
ncbi:MAG: zinc-ribbon domain-containing protein [Lachnospiraceae bacterium]|nr:zinc-ribbon domain-containing protein [Lachnospiraceae bacterium]